MQNELDDLVIDHKQPPTTVREVGIHLIYMSKSMAEIKSTLSNISNSFATKNELIDAIEDRHAEQTIIRDCATALEKRVTRIETIFNGITYKISGVAVIMLVLMVLAYYGLERYFK